MRKRPSFRRISLAGAAVLIVGLAAACGHQNTSGSGARA